LLDYAPSDPDTIVDRVTAESARIALVMRVEPAEMEALSQRVPFTRTVVIQWTCSDNYPWIVEYGRTTICEEETMTPADPAFSNILCYSKCAAVDCCAYANEILQFTVNEVKPSARVFEFDAWMEGVRWSIYPGEPEHFEPYEVTFTAFNLYDGNTRSFTMTSPGRPSKGPSTWGRVKALYR
jgi:hypothetical protein